MRGHLTPDVGRGFMGWLGMSRRAPSRSGVSQRCAVHVSGPEVTAPVDRIGWRQLRVGTVRVLPAHKGVRGDPDTYLRHS